MSAPAASMTIDEAVAASGQKHAVFNVLNHEDGRTVTNEEMDKLQETLQKKIFKLPVDFVREKKSVEFVSAYLETQARDVLGAPYVLPNAKSLTPPSLTDEELQIGFRIQVLDMMKEAYSVGEGLLADPERAEQFRKICVRTGAKSEGHFISEIQSIVKSDAKQEGKLVIRLRERVDEIRSLKEAIKALVMRYSIEVSDTAVFEPPADLSSPFAMITPDAIRTELNKK